jgi:phage terminase large subunit GpA-like protein
MKSAQVAGTESGNNWIGYTIAHNPGLMMVVNPTKSMAKRMSARVQALIDTSEGLDKLVLPARSRDSGNTQIMKNFPGGMILLVGAQSASDLRSFACPFIDFEEVDAYPQDVEGEGPPVKVAEARTFGQGDEYKIYLNSTPAIEQTSVIWKEWLKGDQRHYLMHCPHSGRLIRFEFRYLKLKEPGRYNTAYYACPCGCGLPIEEGLHKTDMLAGGVWVPKAIYGNDDRIKRLEAGDRGELDEFNRESLRRSYSINALYSPIGMMAWSRIMENWDEVQGDYTEMKAFRNTIEGLPWREVGEAPDAEVIYNRRSRTFSQREVPQEVIFLTAGADIGQDHIEVSIYGWGRRRQRWLIEHIRIDGPYNDKSTWDRLDDLLDRRYEHASGAIMGIRRLCIDRGKWTDTVDAWVNTKNARQVTAVKGYDHLDTPFTWAGQKKQHRDGTQSSKTFSIKWALSGVSYLKLELLGQLNLRKESEDDVPAGWLHLPSDVTLGWIKQLTSERRAYRKAGKHGRLKAVWEESGERHEALDCTNYARTAASIEGWDDWSESEFRREEDHLAAAAEDRRIKLHEWQQRNGGGTIDEAIPGIVRPLEALDFGNADAGVMELNSSPLVNSAMTTEKPKAPIAEIGIVGCKPRRFNIPMPNFGTGATDEDD